MLEGISTRPAEFASVSAGLVSLRAKVIASNVVSAPKTGPFCTVCSASVCYDHELLG
jgi:hypothetical protein